MTRKDLDSSSGSTEKPAPASERLRQYLKGLEKKLENVTTMIDYSSSSHRSEKRFPHTETNGNYLRKNVTIYHVFRLCLWSMEGLLRHWFQVYPSQKGARRSSSERLSVLLKFYSRKKNLLFSYKTREIVRTSSYWVAKHPQIQFFYSASFYFCNTEKPSFQLVFC